MHLIYYTKGGQCQKSHKHSGKMTQAIFTKDTLQDEIIDIYDESHKNYGAPKITQKLRETGEKISEKTVGNYMRELGIKAQYIKPYTVTTKDSDFSMDLKNILDENFSPEAPATVFSIFIN